MRPMSPTPGALPAGPGWGFEMSWPGPLLFINVTAGRVQVLAGERDVTRAWPELVSMCSDIDDALIEGQLVEVEAGAPVAFVCSDLLRLYGVDLTARPYRERRGSLSRLADTHPLLTLSPVFDDADATAAAAREHGLGGVVAKRLDSPYRAGTRSADWVRYSFDDHNSAAADNDNSAAADNDNSAAADNDNSGAVEGNNSAAAKGAGATVDPARERGL